MIFIYIYIDIDEYTGIPRYICRHMRRIYADVQGFILRALTGVDPSEVGFGAPCNCGTIPG